jgi:ElaB/YqjD/DUF883 family membrane-anchored ribosome-binding protein
MASNDSILHPQGSGRAQQQVRTMGEQTGKIAADVRELGSMAIGTASEALENVKARGSEALENVKARGSEVLDTVKEKGGEVLSETKERAVRAKDGFGDYVAENPFKSVLIAAGIGALIGYSLRNRN